MDARSKIIQKNRAKIRDVRDLISAKKRPADARYVITKNMSERLGKMGSVPDRRQPHLPGKLHRLADSYMLDAALALDDLIPPLKYSPTKQARASAYRPEYRDLDLLEPPLPRRRAYVDYDAIEDTKPLDSRGGPSFDRLVKEYMSVKQGPPVSSSAVASRYKTSSQTNDDIFELYEAPSRDRRPLPPPPSGLRRYVPGDESHLSYEMRARLEGTPSAPHSMGIFANPTKSLSSSGDSHGSAAARGYRVMVTNLHSSVTVWDIQELFADIGGLVSAVITKPGVAEVVYKTMKDAEDAVEVYHNRQLDGQPMKCHMITQAAPVQQLQRSSSSSSSRKAPPLELDLETLHSALFTSRRH